jgi:hypothetical protein
MMVGMGALYKNTCFAKRTQLKNAHLFGHECVGKNASWVRFKKRGQFEGQEEGEWGRNEDEMAVNEGKRSQNPSEVGPGNAAAERRGYNGSERMTSV